MSDEPILGLRHMNRLRLLETLYRRPASSRGDLVRHTGLSRATASTLVEELVRAGVVQERDASDDAVPAAHGELRLGPRASGRPPVLLSLVPGAAYSVGLDFSHQHIRVAVCDLAGKPVITTSRRPT
jgi:hypothetical protein